MKLNVKKPIIFFDLETTGVDVANDRIVEISMVKVFPNGDRDARTRRVNPEMHIPEQATLIHGITDEDVKDCPTFKEMAKKIAADFKGADLAGYNSARFDLPMLAEEFLRADVDIDLSTRKMIDVQTIFHKKEQRTLSAAYKFYCQQDLVDAHAAMADTKATYEILQSQLDRYPDLQNDMAYLADYTCTSKNVDFAGRIVYNEKGVEVINFGKYKGQPVVDVLKNDPGYYGWILQADFPLTTKQAFTRLRLKI